MTDTIDHNVARTYAEGFLAVKDSTATDFRQDVFDSLQDDARHYIAALDEIDSLKTERAGLLAQIERLNDIRDDDSAEIDRLRQYERAHAMRRASETADARLLVDVDKFGNLFR